jgi:glycosyltransferase involved in cell wall biosynthesis
MQNIEAGPKAAAVSSPIGAARRKLAVVGLSYPFRGGISHFATLQVRALRRRYDVTFLTLSRQYPGFLFPGQTQFDYSAKTLVEPNEQVIDTLNPLTWIAAARRLNREQPELIIFQWWHPFFAPCFGTIARLLRASLRRRVCFLCHNVMPHESNPLQTALTRYAFPGTGYYIVHSEQDRDQLAALRPRATIRKGCHPTYSEFATEGVGDKREARRALGLAEDRRTMLFFGLVRNYKGLRYLIEAMPRVRRAFDGHLLVVGEFYDDKESYLALIEKHGLREAITVVDRYVPNEEVNRYFSAADVAVLPYTSATQSGIVQIAYGLNTPVIVTRVGGLPEVVDDGRTGFVVTPADADALAEAIIRYYEGGFEARFREEIAGQANRFDWDEEVAQVDEMVALARERAGAAA